MDHAIDQSVLETSSPPPGTGVPDPDDIDRVLDWFEAFRGDDTRNLALDEGFALWATYEALGATNHGLLLLREKVDQGRYRRVPVQQSVDGDVLVGDGWRHLDPHRRRVFGVSQYRPAEISVVNATHEGWHASRVPAACNVLIDQLLPAWLDARIRAQQPADTQRAYHQPPPRLQGELAAAECVGVGTNHRMAWEDANRRYEFDRQHNTLEVYSLGTGKWLHEARLDGSVLKTTGGEGRQWGKA